MKLARLLPAFAVVGVVLTAACGGTTSSNNSPSATVPSDLSVSSFSPDYSYMSKLQALQKAGHGMVGVVLPDTTSSTRYVTSDLPALTKSFTNAGYSSSDYSIQNAQGTTTTELAIAQADITKGATVLIVDPIDTPTGVAIQAYAQSHGVKMISYDRATFAGTNTYYISFDNVQVGKLIGQGFLQCASDWGVKNAQVYELDGGRDTDPNATSFAQGYNQAIWGDSTIPQSDGKTNSQGMTLVHEGFAAGWDNTKGGATFQQAFTANAKINATVEANDGLGNAVINVLKNAGIKAKTVPTTGQDAQPQGLENVLLGYQCGTVYKQLFLEAQDAVALATVLRAGQTPPGALINGTTAPPSGQQGSQEPASLLTPLWVTTANMESTVIKDKFVDAATICSAVTAAVCQQYSIS
jgi:D-xylose transport system substrate-binding protein